MTREEFREKMKEIILLEIMTRNDPEEHAKVVAEKRKLEKEYRKSMYEERINVKPKTR